MLEILKQITELLFTFHVFQSIQHREHVVGHITYGLIESFFTPLACCNSMNIGPSSSPSFSLQDKRTLFSIVYGILIGWLLAITK